MSDPKPFREPALQCLTPTHVMKKKTHNKTPHETLSVSAFDKMHLSLQWNCSKENEGGEK